MESAPLGVNQTFSRSTGRLGGYQDRFPSDGTCPRSHPSTSSVCRLHAQMYGLLWVTISIRIRCIIVRFFRTNRVVYYPHGDTPTLSGYSEPRDRDAKMLEG